MIYSFEVSEDNKVIVKLDNKKIDEVGAFDSFESASLWADNVREKYANNPSYVYPDGEEEVPIYS